MIDAIPLLNKKVIENVKLKRQLRNILSVITIDQQGQCWIKKDASDLVKSAIYLLDHVVDR